MTSLILILADWFVPLCLAALCVALVAVLRTLRDVRAMMAAQSAVLVDLAARSHPSAPRDWGVGPSFMAPAVSHSELQAGGR